jgi:hypothetical protein
MVVPLAVLAVTAARLGRESRAFAVLAAAQGSLYVAGLVGIVAGRRARARLLALPAYFCLVNAAALRAIVNVACRRRIDRWEPRRGGAEAAP